MAERIDRRSFLARGAVTGAGIVALGAGGGLLEACGTGSSSPTGQGTSHTSVPSADPAQAAAVDSVVQEQMTQLHLRAAIVRVTVDGKEIHTKAYGESMTGVPATTDMHFRNGAVAIAYVSTLLLQLVDEKKVSLDDKASKWVPEIPQSDQVTLGQLAQMTSGYTDFVIGNAKVDAMIYSDPYRQWTPQELLATVTSIPLLYPPGTNWNYAHTNYLILGLVLEKITGKKVEDLMQEKVLGPLGLTNTSGNNGTPAIPGPALHAYTSERLSFLGIPDGTPFYEDSTFWNPSWTITQGAIQTSDIYDLNTTAVAIGTGKLLSTESYQKMVSPDLRGKTTKLPGCATCAVQNDTYAYGLGLVITGDWLLQAPLFSGEAGAFAYLPSKKAAVSVAVTMAEDAFTPDGSYKPEINGNAGDMLWRQIAGAVVPGNAPPPRQT
ncbi:MAG: serine hydrolase domain-containing protein [Acidimicrobiales bacterium]